MTDPTIDEIMQAMNARLANLPPDTSTDKAMPVDEDSIRKTLVTLTVTADALGWDQWPQFYVIVGSKKDPHVVPIHPPLNENGPGHPVEFMQAAWDAGVRLDSERIHGLALVCEAFRHLHYEEMPEQFRNDFEGELRRDPEFLGMTEEEFDRMARVAHSRAMMMMPPPGHMPNEARVEVRTSYAVFKNGVAMVAMQDHGTDPGAPTFMPLGDAEKTGYLTRSMLEWMQWKRPGGAEDFDRTPTIPADRSGD